MPSTLFDTAGLAIVAYAHVRSDGTSPDTNSGVVTTRVSAPGGGVYDVILPANKAQTGSRDLIFVEPNKVTDGAPVGSSVDDTLPVNPDGSQPKRVSMYNTTTTADCGFSILILRTLIPPPAGSPA